MEKQHKGRVENGNIAGLQFNDALQRAIYVRTKLNPKDITPSQKQSIMEDIEIIANGGLVSPDEDVFINAARILIDYGHKTPSPLHSIFEYEGPNQEIFSKAIYAAANKLDILVSYLVDERKDVQMRTRQEHAVHLINLMAIKNVGEETNLKALQVYERLILTIINGMLMGKFNFDRALQIYTGKTPNAWPQVLAEMERQMSEMASEEFRPRLNAFLERPTEEVRMDGEVLAKTLLKRYGFSRREIDKLFTDWSRDLWPWREINYVNLARNIDAIFELEQSVPGVTKQLLTQFGIKNPGRYNAKLLLDQWTYANDRTNSWGIIIYPHADWNGSFHYGHWVLSDFGEQLGALYQKTDHRYRLRIVEVGDTSDLEKKALFLTEKYGPASFAIIGGHGSPNEIHLGHTHKRERSNKKGRSCIKSSNKKFFFTRGANCFIFLFNRS